MQQLLKDNSSQFQNITLSLSDYQKSKVNAHEISIDQKMYDVKSAKFIGCKVELVIIHDKKEETILKNITKYANSRGLPGSQIPVYLQRLLSLNYLSPNIDRTFFIPSLLIQVFRSAQLILLSSISDIPSPPPKLV